MVKKYLSFILMLLALSCFSQEAKTIFDVARSGTLNEASELFKKNPKIVNSINEAGYSPLILACYRGNTEVAKFLIKNGADLNYNNEMGTPLMAAVVKNNLEIVNLLIDKNVNVELKDGNGTTALIYASMFKNHEVAKLLIKAKANYETKDNRGNSAIDYAILADDDQLIQILKTK